MQSLVQLVVCSFAAFFGLMLFGGVTLRSSLLFSLAISLQFLVGVFIYLTFMRRPSYSSLELFGTGVVLGAATFTLLFQLSLVVFEPLSNVLWWVLPLLASLGLLLRNRKLPAIHHPQMWNLVALAIISVIGTLLMSDYWLANPLEFSEYVAYHPDLSYHEAISQGLAQFGPRETPWLAGESFTYHWLGDAWAGAVSRSLDMQPYEALSRGLYIFSITVSAVLAWVLSKKVSKVRLSGPLGALAIVAVTPIGLGVVYSYSVFRTDISPTHTFSTPVALSVIIVSLRILRGATSVSPYFLLGFLGFVLAATRVPMAMTLLGGLLLIFIWRAFTRSDTAQLRTLGVLLLALSSGVVFAYLVILRTSAPSGNTSLSFGPNTDIASLFALYPYTGFADFALATLGLVASSSLIFLGLLRILVSTQLKEVRTLVGWIFGSAMVGVVGTIGLTQVGRSQVSFLWAATAVAAPFLGMATAESISCLRKRSWIFVSILGGGLAGFFSIFLYENTRALWFAGYIRWLIPMITLAILCIVVLLLLKERIFVRINRNRVISSATIFMLAASIVAVTTATTTRVYLTQAVEVDQSTPLSITESHIEAALWFKENRSSTDPGYIVTNRLCDVLEAVPPACVSTTYITSALTGGPVLIEGFSYGIPSLPKWARERITNSFDFGREATPKLVSALVDSNVRYIWLDKAVGLSGDWRSFGDIIFENDSVVILEIE